MYTFGKGRHVFGKINDLNKEIITLNYVLQQSQRQWTENLRIERKTSIKLYYITG